MDVDNVIKLLPMPDALKQSLHSSMADPVEYRKSGLSLNHIIGCPLECTYCVRHLFGTYAIKRPNLLMNDDEAVNYLVSHRFFQPHKTPLQLFNRATDPFLPSVKPHTFNVLENLDRRGLQNHILIITRYKISNEDCKILNSYSSLKITILVTYSGIDDKNIEPIDSNIAKQSLINAFINANRYRTVLYWRPIVPGINDSLPHLQAAAELSKFAHATVFTGLFFRREIEEYYQANGLPPLYKEQGRRKILPQRLEERIINFFAANMPTSPIFRKTSCAVSYAHSLPDYNGHYCIRELCDICPQQQRSLCSKATLEPHPSDVLALAESMGAVGIPKIGKRAIEVEGLDEQRRYYIQHALNYQVHDPRYPHKLGRHGRADIGWEELQDEHQ